MRVRKLDAAQSSVEIDGVQTQILNEFDILVTKGNEYYAIVAILGTEFVMNLGGPELASYDQWLKANNGASFLYTKKN